MARILGLDWDQNQLHLVTATRGRGGVRIDNAVVGDGEWAVNFAQAEATGQRLRELMKEAGIPPAPVVISVGRERVILKEIRHPQVPAGEEPAVVRFQAAKELTEAAEDLVIDYTPRGNGGPNGERCALTFAVRRELLAFFQSVCKAAGLKLLALTPRGFGSAFCLKCCGGAALPESPDAVVAILTVADTWADFSVVRGATVLLTRSVNVHGNLAAEVRRNLAVYAGQAQVGNGQGAVQALYVAGNGEAGALRQQLQDVLDIPIHRLDPFAHEPQVETQGGKRGGFGPAVGLVQAHASGQAAPINFLRPKEPVKGADPLRRRKVLLGALAAAVVVAAVVGAWYLLRAKGNEVAALRARKNDYENRLKQLAPDVKQIGALKEWNENSVSWLDEIYEIAAKMDYRQGFRITELRAVPKQTLLTKGGKDKTVSKYVGQVLLTGEVRLADEKLVDKLKTALNDAHHRAMVEKLAFAQGSGLGTKQDTKVFVMRVDVAHQPARKYQTVFTPPSAPPAQPAVEPEEEDDGDEGGQP